MGQGGKKGEVGAAGVRVGFPRGFLGFPHRFSRGFLGFPKGFPQGFPRGFLGFPGVSEGRATKNAFTGAYVLLKFWQRAVGFLLHARSPIIIL